MSTSHNLDASQVLRSVYDTATDALKTRVNAVVSGVQEVLISHADDSIKLGDGTDFAAIDPDGSVQTRQVAQLVPYAYDYVGVTYPTSSSEVFVYKTGGSGGTTVATVTVTYTDATKANVSSVART